MISYAIRHNLIERIRKRLINGYDTNYTFTGADGNCLHYAIINQKFEIVKLLLDYGANINFKNRRQDSALIMAIEYYPIIVEYLISRGSDINTQNINGETPLIIAAERRNIDVIMLLIRSGCNPKIRDCDNKTFIDYMKEDYNLIDEIEDHGVYGDENRLIQFIHEILKLINLRPLLKHCTDFVAANLSQFKNSELNLLNKDIKLLLFNSHKDLFRNKYCPYSLHII